MGPFHIKIATAPASEPVTVAEAKARLRITISDEDADLAILLAGARELCEAGCQRAFITQTWDLYLDDFPRKCEGEIRVPRPPLQSVTHVKYYDTAKVLQTVDSADYFVSLVSEPGRIVPALGYWPATYDRPDAVQIRFVAGYGAASAVPGAAKNAILLAMRAMRDDPGAPLPSAARALLDTLEAGEVR